MNKSVRIKIATETGINMAKQYTYLPAVHERAYYGALFQAADDERMGSIGGAKAVAFFTRSKLPITVLKDIWTLSDQPPTNALDPLKFAVAIRLIQCEQNGIHLPTIASSDLSQGLPPNLRPAFFEGIPPPPPPPQGAASTPAAGMVPGQPPQAPRPPVSVPNQPMAGGHHDSVSVAGSASVGGGGGGGAPSVPHNHQLAIQDPYMITPSEQVRYEQLFPDYVHQDPTGTYMSGGEAVALFNKSGLSQAILSQIWNMVDTNPVDNQLDKIEFVLAMHLIVCISKKNLPVPPSLPLSLKNLKAQQHQQPPTQNNNYNAVPQTIYQPNPASQPAMSSTMSMGGPPPSTPERSQFQQQPMSAMPSPTMGAMSNIAPPPQMMTNTMPPSMPTTNSISGGGGASTMAGPPPLSQPGGVSISDAFEGLDGIGGGMGDVMKNPTASGFHYTAGGDTGSISSYHASTPEVSTKHHLTFEQRADIVVETISDPAPEQYSNHVDTTINHSGNANKDYVTSYKMGDSNSELQKLKEALQKLQAENISLKASMGSLSLEEQDTQKELNATIAEVTKLSNDLTKTRAQVLASKSRLLQAAAELNAAKEKTSVLKDLISDATITKQAIDEAHESIENANEVLARSMGVGNPSTAGASSTFQTAPAPAIAEEDLFGGWGSDDGGAVNAPLPALGSGNFSSAAASSVDESQPSSTYYNNPPQVQMESSQPTHSSPMPSYSYNPNPEPTPPAMSTNMYNGGGYTGGSGMGGHNRDMSGNDFGEVMGSSPSLQPPLPTIQQYDSGFGSSMGATTYDSIPHVTSLKEVEDLKAKSKEADDVAKDAEASRRQLVAQLEELRKLADEAESKVRAASEKPTKKKGILGRGGAIQKKDAKEIERLTMDARDKKDALLLAQSQVKDAESLAMATKREAERLNKEAEDAQMSVAAAASMQDQGSKQHQMTIATQQSPRYDLPNAGGMMPLQVYDNPGTTGIDYSNPFG